METNQNINQIDLEKLSKTKLIEMIQEYREKLEGMEEIGHILRIDSVRS